MEEYLKKFASQFNINSELPQKSSFQLNGFKCIYDRSFFEFSLSHLNKNKTNYQSEPTKYLKLVNYLSLFMKDSEKIRLRDHLKKHFILEVDFENEEKNSLVYKNQGFKNDIITFLKCCESKKLERIQEILELFNKKYGYNITDIFKFCLTNNKLLRVIPELSDKIINILQSLKEIKIINSFTFDLLKGDKIKSDLHNRRFNDRRLDVHNQFIKIIKEHEITEFELANMDNLKLFVYDIIVHEYDLKANGLEKAKFITFGSYSNGFALKNSDVDAMIITDNYVDERSLLISLSRSLKSLYRYDYKVLCLADDRIRVPIIKIESNDGKDKLDLAINNILGAANTMLLKTYSEINETCKNFILLLKIWAKNNNISNQNSLSSYAITLMGIYFLQLKKIIPSIQRIAKKKNHENLPIVKIKRMVRDYKFEEFETNLIFEHNMEEIREYMKKKSYDMKEHNLYDIFRDFLIFYKKDGIFLKNSLKCDIKKGKLSFVKKGYEFDYLFSIKDPFDKKHNPGDRLNKQKTKNNYLAENFLYTIETSLKNLNEFKLKEIFKL